MGAGFVFVAMCGHRRRVLIRRYAFAKPRGTMRNSRACSVTMGLLQVKNTTPPTGADISSITSPVIGETISARSVPPLTISPALTKGWKMPPEGARVKSPPVVRPGARAMPPPVAGSSGEPSPGRTRFALRRPGSAPRRSDRVACAETSRESPRPPARRGLPAPARAVAKCSPHLPRATFPVNDLPIAPNRAPLPDSPVNDPWMP